ncbi:MAG: hypothetical protein ACO3EZ_03955 [Prochlorotrichaceae cyanobacterium]
MLRCLVRVDLETIVKVKCDRLSVGLRYETQKAQVYYGLERSFLGVIITAEKRSF